jgi:hypothetical protein
LLAAVVVTPNLVADNAEAALELVPTPTPTVELVAVPFTVGVTLISEPIPVTLEVDSSEVPLAPPTTVIPVVAVVSALSWVLL